MSQVQGNESVQASPEVAKHEDRQVVERDAPLTAPAPTGVLIGAGG